MAHIPQSLVLFTLALLVLTLAPISAAQNLSISIFANTTSNSGGSSSFPIVTSNGTFTPPTSTPSTSTTTIPSHSSIGSTRTSTTRTTTSILTTGSILPNSEAGNYGPEIRIVCGVLILGLGAGVVGGL